MTREAFLELIAACQRVTTVEIEEAGVRGGRFNELWIRESDLYAVANQLPMTSSFWLCGDCQRRHRWWTTTCPVSARPRAVVEVLPAADAVDPPHATDSGTPTTRA